MRRVALFALLGFGGLTLPVFGQTFSIDVNSPEVVIGGEQPGNLYIPGAVFGPVFPPVLPPAVLNLNITGEVNAISFGRAPNSFLANATVFFSLDRGSAGVAGTASANEFNSGGGVSEQSSDIFSSPLNGSNMLFADGDGVVQAGNPNPAAFPLGTGEFPTYPFPPGPVPVGGADLDALDLRANLIGLGSPTGRLFLSLDPFSAFPFSSGDVFVDPTGMGGPLNNYANEGQLGILPIGIPQGSNDVDALVVYDDGDNLFGPGADIVLFSLAPGSAYLGQVDPFTGLTIEAGDVLIDAASAQAILGTPSGTGAAILHTAESLGLRTMRAGFQSSDNLNALDVVPEPSSIALLVVGGLAVALRRVTRCTKRTLHHSGERA